MKFLYCVTLFLILADYASGQVLHCYVCDGDDCTNNSQMRQEVCGPQDMTTEPPESTTTIGSNIVTELTTTPKETEATASSEWPGSETTTKPGAINTPQTTANPVMTEATTEPATSTTRSERTTIVIAAVAQNILQNTTTLESETTEEPEATTIKTEKNTIETEATASSEGTRSETTTKRSATTVESEATEEPEATTTKEIETTVVTETTMPSDTVTPQATATATKSSSLEDNFAETETTTIASEIEELGKTTSRPETGPVFNETELTTKTTTSKPETLHTETTGSKTETTTTTEQQGIGVFEEDDASEETADAAQSETIAIENETTTISVEMSTKDSVSITAEVDATTDQPETEQILAVDPGAVMIQTAQSTIEPSKETTVSSAQTTTTSAGTSSTMLEPEITADTEEMTITTQKPITNIAASSQRFPSPSNMLISNYRSHSRVRRAANSTAYGCYSANYKDNNQIKMKKGCVAIPTEKSACQVIAEKVGGNIVDGSCKICVKDLCNSSSIQKLSISVLLIVVFVKYLM